MRKVALWVAVILLALAAGGAWYVKGKKQVIVITQEQIESALAQRFPASDEFLLIFKLTYTNPQVVLLEEADRIQVGLDATLEMRLGRASKMVGGGSTLTCGLRYDAGTQSFFLTDVVFERLEVQGIPPEYAGRVKEAAGQAAQRILATRPVYQLRAKDTKTAAAKLLLKDVQVRAQAVHVTLGLW